LHRPDRQSEQSSLRPAAFDENRALVALGAAQLAPDRLGLQHLDARLERADRIGQFAGRDVAQPFGFGVQLFAHADPSSSAPIASANSPDETWRNRLASGSSFSPMLILLGG
jgi:hypothetical protein